MTNPDYTIELMSIRIEPSWKQRLAGEFTQDYFLQLSQFVKSEYQQHQVYPKPQNIFRAFDHCPFNAVKVVILGQDPYHGPNQANGLCFSVSDGILHPPSLQNIFKELKADLDKPIPQSGNLDHWADQGVLLLNATLTVRAAQAGSHQKKGWEQFTDSVIKVLSDQKQDLVFLLWGKYAQDKGKVIDRTKHLVLEAAHPSPLSAHQGFFGCRHFSKTNLYLMLHGHDPIKW
jgi:uracil-DNA glycosylase